MSTAFSASIKATALCALTAVAALLFCPSPAAATWELPANLSCSDPPLGVAYSNLRYYSGAVNCGNLLLESDIGGTHPWVPPKVTLPHTTLRKRHRGGDKLYTLIYLDPYVDVPNNGTWPDCEPNCVGSKGPARHWLVGNIPSTMLEHGDLSGATTVSKFKGPSPAYGSHPYGLFHFEQPAGKDKIAFAPLPSPLGIYDFDVAAWLSKYGFKHGPVATNWHVTMHADPRK